MIAPEVLLIGVFVVLLLAGVPVAVVLGLAGAAGILVGLDLASLSMIGTNVYNGIAKYPLIAIPLFILTGLAFERSGVAERLVRFASALVGPRRGGLAVVAVLVSLIMGGMSGSGPADAAAVATVMIPAMARAGYPKAFSAGLIAASSSTAIIIPPSIALIIYSVMVPGTDLRALFAAGLIPGLLCGLAIILPVIWLSYRHKFGSAEGEAERPPLGRSFLDALPGLLAPVIILGGLRIGLFTPTEAAAVAAVYGLLVGTLLHRTLGWREIYRILADGAEITAVVMIIISFAGLFAWAGSTLGVFSAAAEGLLSISDQAWVVLGLIMVFLLLAGMVLDGVSIYLIMLPLLMPIVHAFEWNTVWFGILMAMNIAIGQFTPPIAVNLMVTTRIAGVGMEDTMKWVVWMLASMVGMLMLIALFPDIALWLPEALDFRTGR
ncbi:TRAP transporter large permease [Fodinicurvata halophila]|uniref:TRAP transporter large permease protein n=1 Tax=Fodinicurvata halophila TaxID=1419723 RepID=A0ABV8UJB6_9PROT